MSASDAFVEGFKYVYPDTKLLAAEIKLIYSRVRCGLYHDGFTKRKVFIDSGDATPFEVSQGKLKMNPHLVVKDIAASFDKYVKELESTNNRTKPKRIAFKKLFDFNYFS